VAQLNYKHLRKQLKDLHLDERCITVGYCPDANWRNLWNWV